MSVRFRFTLSDVDAENFVDILHDSETTVLGHMITCDDLAQRAWLESRLTYVKALQAKVLKGAKRVADIKQRKRT